MTLAKARWYNNADFPVVLTIDDLTYGYMDLTGTGLQPFNDWGYGCRRPGSVFRYFEEQILARHPELKYTVFLPCGTNSLGRVDTPDPGHVGDVFESAEFGTLLTHIVATGNEIAYHGHDHGRRNPTVVSESWIDEDLDYTPEEYRALVTHDVQRMQQEYGITIRGGRSPAYRNNPPLLATVTSGLFQWWSFHYTPLQCPYAYRHGIFEFPTNLSGGRFHRRPGHWRDLLSEFLAERGLYRLMQQRAIIVVTEHFTSTRPDGRRQSPSVFDDAESLHRIFAFFKGHNAWYATCSEIARYQDTYDHSTLTPGPDGSYTLRCAGHWDQPRLSLVSDREYLRDTGSGAVLRGAYRRGSFVFDNVVSGTYRAP